MKRNTYPKNPASDALEEHIVVNAAHKDRPYELLVQLVWKYFEDEIRQAMTEVQDSIISEKVGLQQQPRSRKQVGK